MEPIARTVSAPSFPTVTAVTPIYFVGDSNVLTFHNLLLNVPAFFAQPVVSTAHYLPSLTAHSLFARDALEERVRAFVDDHVFTDPFDRREGRQPDVDLAIARELRSRFAPPADDERNIARDPAVVLMAGTLDLLALVSTIGPAVDFYCEDSAYRSEAFPTPVLPIVPRDAVVELVERQFAPLRPALRALKQRGIEHLYLHSLHPPTVDDREYCLIRGAVCSAKLRYKIALEINRVFADAARSEGVGFLDLWDLTTRDGTLDPRFRYDGDHLNREAAQLTLETLLGDLVRRRARPLEEC